MKEPTSSFLFTLLFFFLLCIFSSFKLDFPTSQVQIFPFFLFEKHYFPSFCLMVVYSEVRHISPSVSFFFASLGASLISSSGHCPQIEVSTLRDGSLGLVLADLYPLLR